MTLEDLQQSKRETLFHALTFVVGFSLIFLALGAGATVFGQLMLRYRDWISRVGGVLIIVFGLYLLGVLNLGFLARDTRMHPSLRPPPWPTPIRGTASGGRPQRRALYIARTLTRNWST